MNYAQYKLSSLSSNIMIMKYINTKILPTFSISANNCLFLGHNNCKIDKSVGQHGTFNVAFPEK